MSSLEDRPRSGVVKLASCDGCQLTLLDLEDDLLPIVGRFELVEFPEATSRRSEGPYDVLRFALRALGDEAGAEEAERDFAEAQALRLARTDGD